MLLKAAMIGMAIALALMLVVCVWPTPRALAAFLSVGLGAAAGSIVAFVVYVLRDLRARRAL